MEFLIQIVLHTTCSISNLASHLQESQQGHVKIATHLDIDIYIIHQTKA